MRVAIIGSGPTGIVLGAGLARRGHQVVAVDRDPGPDPAGRWQRRGVMQFEHAHGFRPQVFDVVHRQWPEAMQEWIALGAECRELDLPGRPVGVFSRRSTFERALRRAARQQPGLMLRTGHVDRVSTSAGRAAGLVVDHGTLDADLVVDASGRSGLLARAGRGGSAELLEIARPAVIGGDCGIAYVDRKYRLRPGEQRGAMSSPIGWSGSFDGYLVLVFPHERRHFSVVFVRPTANTALKELRHEVAFEAACRAIPAVREWTDPQRSIAISSVLVGGALRNTFHPQLGLPGLVTVGDAVSTTAPTAGRGVAMAMLQVDHLLGLLDADRDPHTVVEPFGAWCDQQMLPWVLDHISCDDGAARRWQGEALDLDHPLPSDLVVAAAEAQPRLWPLVAPYLAMTDLPSSLSAAEPLARDVYRTGWRPKHAEGPSAAELVNLIDDAMRRVA